MAITDPQTKTNFDNNALDDPKAAFTELAGNVDTYNALVALLKVICTLNIGDGLKDDGLGNLDLDLGTNPGLEIVSAKLTAKVLAGAGLKKTASGLELDIEGATSETVVDPANDTVLMKDNSAVTASKVREVKIQDIAPGLSADSVTQTEIANAAVGTGELKTATGDMATAAANSFVTGPGGEYGFWPTVKLSTADNRSSYLSAVDTVVDDTLGTTFLQRFDFGSTGAETMTVRQRYIQASPPYDLGDGEVSGFLFAIINNGTGLIESTYLAEDPPWANNGPTNIRPDRVDKKTKKRYKMIVERDLTIHDIMDPRYYRKREIEVTPSFKNSDMGLIPHPFIGNNLTGKTVVIIDPMSPIITKLNDIKNSGDDAQEVIFGGYLNIGNAELNRGRPKGIMSISVKMKNSRGL